MPRQLTAVALFAAASLCCACGASQNNANIEPEIATTPLPALTLEGPFASFDDYCAQRGFPACEEEQVIHQNSLKLLDGSFAVTTGGLVRDAESQRRIFLVGEPDALYALPHTHSNVWNPDTDTRSHFGMVMGLRDKGYPEGTFAVQIMANIEEPTDNPEDPLTTSLQTTYICQIGSAPLKCVELPLEAGSSTALSDGKSGPHDHFAIHLLTHIEGQPNTIEVTALASDPKTPHADVLTPPGVYQLIFE